MWVTIKITLSWLDLKSSTFRHSPVGLLFIHTIIHSFCHPVIHPAFGHPVIQSPHHRVVLSFVTLSLSLCHSVILIIFQRVIQSPHHRVVLSFGHAVIKSLSSCHSPYIRSPCHSVIPSPRRPVIRSRCH